MTHGAVSRHVRMLEDKLGLPLLKRSAHGTEPTAEGQRLADGVLRGFHLIRASVEQLDPGPLTLSCSESIMMYWLLPRLRRFQEANADVELRFNMGYGPVDFARDNISVALRLSTIEPPRTSSAPGLSPNGSARCVHRPICGPFDWLRQPICRARD